MSEYMYISYAQYSSYLWGTYKLNATVRILYHGETVSCSTYSQALGAIHECFFADEI